MNLITSDKNKIIKLVSSLKIKKYREKLNLIVIEGEKIVLEIPPDWTTEFIICSEKYYNNLKNRKFNAQVYIVNDKLFKKISETNNSQGIIAVCKIKKYNYFKVLEKKNPCFVLLDRIMDPGNLGTIIRTAEALSFDAIFLSKGSVDIYNPKVLRSTMGSIFHLPIFQNCDFNDLILKLKENNIKIISSDLKANNYINSINLSGALAIVIGNEANGISNEVIKNSDVLIKIPMLGKVQSINASIAASIIFYEITKKRFDKF